MRQFIFALCLLLSALSQAAEGLVRLPWLEAPKVELMDLSSNKHSLAEFRGQVVVVNFWASWCGACLEEAASLNRASKLLAADGIALVAINSGEDEETVRQYQQQWQMEFPLWLDQDLKATDGFEVRGMPMTFILDAEGKIVLRALGSRQWDEPELLEKIRAQKAP